MRLNKFISHNTKYSRREADALIEAGEVKINKETVKNFGDDVDFYDEVTVKGKRVKKKTEFTVVVYNKPKGELVSKKDPQGRTTIYHKLPGKFRTFNYVGRLDFASEGLLLLTDSVDVANKLAQSNLERVYKVKVNGFITEKIIKAMQEGVKHSDATQGAHEKTEIKSMDFSPFSWFEIQKNGKNYSTIKVALTEGKNREIRRFFGGFGLDVLDLKRLSYGWISLDALPTGKTRFLEKSDYNKLHDFIHQK
ncbi:MAG: pseudouridine synthase [Campylobacterota bacterium]